MDKVRLLKTLELVIEDAENDPKRFEGALMDGRTVAQLHGQLCAMVYALGQVLKVVVDEME